MENEIKKRHSKDFVKKYHGGDFNDEIEKETPDQRETYMQNDLNIAKKDPTNLSVKIEIDIIIIILFIISLGTRIYRLVEPNNIVFDELHYGKYVSLYMKKTFFFDSHPPLGKQLIALFAYFADYSGEFKFERIGHSYTEEVPLYSLRLFPALCGSVLAPITYKILAEMHISKWASILGGLLIICDNALLTQSRFILMEPILLMFTMCGILSLLKFRNSLPYTFQWWFTFILGIILLTCALCVKYVGFFSCCLGILIVVCQFWRQIGDKNLTTSALLKQGSIMIATACIVSSAVYLSIFFCHLSILSKAGPHDSVMTSAFQASLQGGLASITAGQPLKIGHGSQITLRHTHGRTCWLHSHAHTYPIRYADKRGSSHQQQVTCYSFKDVNNWWIVKRPDRNDLSVGDKVDVIKHNDVIQLVHGITSRALNSHDVAAPVTPQCQEVSCYIDYNVSMPAQNLWKVEIINKDHEGIEWHTIQSQIRLVHVSSNQALRYTGRQLPDWGFNQHEIVTDRVIDQQDTVWNVEEHRYTKSDDQKERELDLVNAEMIPTSNTDLSFWRKFTELQYKMLFSAQESQSHMYSSEPLHWPLMTRGIAYWVDEKTNAQIHLLGNLVIWYSATFSILVYVSTLTVYMLRRRRLCYDINDHIWSKFILSGEIFLSGYLLHYIPYFFFERTLFLHHYLPAFVFKVLLLASILDHIHDLCKHFNKGYIANIFKTVIVFWLLYIVYTYKYFSVLSYGITQLEPEDIMKLKWKDSWDFIMHKHTS